MVTGNWLDLRLIPGMDRDFSLFHHVQTGSGAHASSFLMSTGDVLGGIKRPKLEADNSSTSSVNIKIHTAIYSCPQTFSRCGALN
jgi:hypothetical protein